ncbi:ErfK/YbiS/YcfS/YnhG family protein [Hyphomicrobium denitrificans ATCC 51888]|uniref:ErfK/YbiS/YcfS/YnhG family protein n=2 Tax=Hyphomicrobium denitrificans TaxID=53399 RepID=D8JXJ2_HYPDA|nr:ErfK/YbiS/YcfS/YnhG family protein [Hyphomicrobium denitrificans ATCC 51888]
MERANWLAAVLFLLGTLPALHAARAEEQAAAKPLPATTEAALLMKEIVPEAPVYIRVFKEESELEVWKARPNGRYALVKTFPICNWGGTLGPKQTQGDRMSPEGFYAATPGGMKPDSKYHLAFNIGYPNALDRALGRTGAYIMVHGDCRSVGCFAMSDKLIEEIYAFVRDALAAGEPSVPVHVFPFRMTASNIKRHADNPARTTWAPLKQAYDDFAETREPPKVGMCSKRYVVNSLTPVGMDPNAACPTLIGKRLAPLSPRMSKRLAKNDPSLEAQGKKLKSAEASSGIGGFFTSLSWGSTTATVSRPSRQSSDASLGAVQPLLNP